MRHKTLFSITVRVEKDEKNFESIDEWHHERTWFHQIQINRTKSIRCYLKDWKFSKTSEVFLPVFCNIGFITMQRHRYYAINFKLKVKWRETKFRRKKSENNFRIMITTLLEHCATHSTLKKIESCVKKYAWNCGIRSISDFWSIIWKSRVKIIISDFGFWIIRSLLGKTWNVWVTEKLKNFITCFA